MSGTSERGHPRVGSTLHPSSDQPSNRPAGFAHYPRPPSFPGFYTGPLDHLSAISHPTLPPHTMEGTLESRWEGQEYSSPTAPAEARACILSSLPSPHLLAASTHCGRVFSHPLTLIF